jgi:hypothetical protein
MASGTDERLMGVWGTSPTDVFAVGYWNGAILHYDGSAWSSMTGATTDGLHAVWGTTPTDVYALGHDGVILHYDGTAWNAMTSGTDEDLFGVWGTSSHVYAVGSHGLVLRGTR